MASSSISSLSAGAYGPISPTVASIWGTAPSPPDPSDDDPYVQYEKTGKKITRAFRIWFAIMVGMFAVYALFRLLL